MSNDEWGSPLTDLPPRHDFKSGDLIGVLRSAEVRDLNDPNNAGQKKETRLYVFDTDNGTTALWGSAQLDQMLPNHVDHRVKVVNTGEKVDIGGGRSVRKFDVFCATCNKG